MGITGLRWGLRIAARSGLVGSQANRIGDRVTFTSAARSRAGSDYTRTRECGRKGQQIRGIDSLA